MTNQEELKSHLTPNYAKFPIKIKTGQGSYIWDEDGKKYLDFIQGIAVNTLGHSNRKIAKTLSLQARRLVHCSNLYSIKEQEDLAKVLVEEIVKESGKCFFCNSGAEANEALFKLSRLYGKTFSQVRTEVITFKNSFHGRTFAGISLTGQEKIQKGFDPLIEKIRYLEFNNLDNLSEISDRTSAVFIEIIQGEGGINIASKEFLKELYKICKEKKVLLFVDEIQAGLGRTGDFCSYNSVLGNSEEFIPDGISWAKGLGGGVPIGAIWIRDKKIENSTHSLCDLFQPGTHGSTFGGNPLCCAVAKVVIDEIIKRKHHKKAKNLGKYLISEINKINSKLIKEVRGLGLMIGIEINEEEVKKITDYQEQSPSLYFVKKLIANGLITVGAGTKTIRLLPSLTVTKKEIDEAVKILKKVF